MVNKRDKAVDTEIFELFTNFVARGRALHNGVPVSAVSRVLINQPDIFDFVFV